MGYDDNTPLAGVTGGGLPALIWKKLMTEIHDEKPQDLKLHNFDKKYSTAPNKFRKIKKSDKGGSSESFLQDIIDFLFN